MKVGETYRYMGEMCELTAIGRNSVLLVNNCGEELMANRDNFFAFAIPYANLPESAYSVLYPGGSVDAANMSLETATALAEAYGGSARPIRVIYEEVSE